MHEPDDHGSTIPTPAPAPAPTSAQAPAPAAGARPAPPDLTVLPSSLLDVIVEVTRSVLQRLPQSEVSAAARSVLRFDRRGLASAAARRQVVALLDREPAIAATVADGIGQRTAAGEWRTRFAEGDGAAVVVECAHHGALAELVAALWAQPPPRIEFAFGLCAAAAAGADAARAHAATVERQQLDLAAARDSVQRLDAQVAELRANLEHANAELHGERTTRRGRDEEAAAAAAAAAAERQRVADELQAARERIHRLEEQVAHEARRTAERDEQLRESRETLRSLREGDAAVVRQRDELHSLAEAAKRVAEGLIALDRAVQSAPEVRPAPTDGRSEPHRPKAPTRRARMTVPGGHAADTPQGAAAMFAATPDFVYVVDGYNVAKQVWPSATAQEQRDRLVMQLRAVHHRYGCDVVVCFDGADDNTTRTGSHQRGVRVIFSSGSEEADDVVLEYVAGLPKRFPVVVATSDGWLRDELQRHGPTLIGASTAGDLHRTASRR